jgi:hypothetical protein
MLPAAYVHSAAQSTSPPGASTSNATQAATGNGQAQPTDSSSTFVDMSDAELAKEIHGLKHLQPAQNQNDLPLILQRAGTAVADFFNNFSNTTCNEQIIARVDTPLQVSEYHFDAENQYLALVPKGEPKTHLKEMRTDFRGDPVQLNAHNGVVTIGFVSMIVHFSPEFQNDSRFRLLGRENLEGRDAYVVAFAQRPAVARQTLLAVFSNRRAVVFMQGVAWIDPENFRIIRLRTDLLRPEPIIGLKKETTVIDYTEVKFGQSGKTLWLPRKVKVDGQLNRYAFHNLHLYSDYRIFNVEAKEKPKNP